MTFARSTHHSHPLPTQSRQGRGRVGRRTRPRHGRVRPLACSALTFTLLVGSPVARADDLPTFADRPDEDIRDADRTFALLLNPLAMAAGIFGGEADFVLGRYAAVALEGDLYRRSDAVGEVLGVGLLVYPLGGAFCRLYLEPRVAYARPLNERIAKVDWSVDAFGFGATAGWQWTWDYGFSVRIGGGALYFLGGPREAAPSGALDVGPQVVFDGSVGWTF
jgi:hypothetical protein